MVRALWILAGVGQSILALGQVPQPAPAAPQGPPWTYADQASWSKLSGSKCGDTGDQSPLDIVSARTSKQLPRPLTTSGHASFFSGLVWNYSAPMMNVLLGTTPRGWQVMVAPPFDTTLTFLNGKYFYLRRIEFNSPSENSLGGQSFDMEMQLVHTAEDGQLLVNSVFLQVGLVEGNEYLSTFWPQFSPTVSADGIPTRIGNPYAALPDDKSLFAYNGSGTVPPCGTDAIWMVFKEPLWISRAQRDLYRQALNASSSPSAFLRFGPPPQGVVQPWSTELGMNNRILQPQGSRQIMYFEMSNVPAKSSFDFTKGHFWGFLGIGLLLFSVVIGLCALCCLLCGAKRSVRTKEMIYAESDEDRQPLRGAGNMFPQPSMQHVHPQVQLWQGQAQGQGMMTRPQMGMGRQPPFVPPRTQPAFGGRPGTYAMNYR
mmetsp:Transcript_12098/g.28675  ORF Transcript_12098/g.28675 Transcript_12098/m.28675 type:complete len:429 (+) Transcript_12098:57-1343(+)